MLHGFFAKIDKRVFDKRLKNIFTKYYKRGDRGNNDTKDAVGTGNNDDSFVYSSRLQRHTKINSAPAGSTVGHNSH